MNLKTLSSKAKNRTLYVGLTYKELKNLFNIDINGEYDNCKIKYSQIDSFVKTIEILNKHETLITEKAAGLALKENREREEAERAKELEHKEIIHRVESTNGERLKYDNNTTRVREECNERSSKVCSIVTEIKTPENGVGDRAIEEGYKIPRKYSTWVAKYPDQKCDLIADICNQPRAAQEIWDKIQEGYSGIALLADPGLGKTYIIGSVLKNFIEQGKIKELGCISPFPIVYTTKMTVVEQTRGVLREEFNIDPSLVKVINIEYLRSELGAMFVKETLSIKNGQEVIKYKWTQYIHPVLFIWDEFQMLARSVSQQSKIAQAVSDIFYEYDVPVIQIFISATPFSRVSEAKVFTVATRHKINDEVITNDSWHKFSNVISGHDDPESYSEDAIKNLMEELDPYIVKIHDINLKFKSYITTQGMTFETKEEREIYEKAWEIFQEKKRKIEGDDSLSEGQARMSILGQFTVYRKAAENAKCYQIARFANDCVNNKEAPGIGFAFKSSMVKTYSILINDFGWSREDVSFIWGGSTESLSDKQKLLKRIKASGLEDILKRETNIKLEDFGIDLNELHEKSSEQYNWEKAHRLLSQNPKEREQERLRFQRQDSKALLFSFKAGGTGLSAHHERRFPKALTRRGFFTPIYSEKEMLQAFGRLPRITSISDTYQICGYYRGTIEEEVMERLKMKLRCARHVSSRTDSWEDIVTGRSRSMEDFQMIEDTESFDDDNSNAKLLEYVDSV